MRNTKSALSWLATLFLSAGLASLPIQTDAQTETSSGASAPAQATQNTSDQGNQNPEIVKMSSFEVTTTQGHGYTASTAAAAFKTNESLMDIPQGDIVVTADMIRDVGYQNTTDVLQYFGVETLIQGETISLRGGSAFDIPYVDEMPQFAFFQDDSVIDSFEVIKGPAQTLYLNASLPGLVLKTTKKPLPFNQDVVDASIDQFGLYRVTLDMTGPIGKLGDAEFSYRLVGLYQHGESYFYNIVNNRNLLFPEFQVNYHNTTVRVYYNLQTIHGTEQSIDFITPSGALYTGAGRREANEPPNNMVEWEDKTLFAEVLQKISDTWETRLSAAYWTDTNFGPGMSVGTVDWDNNTESFYSRLSDEKWHFWTVLNDWQGHYRLFDLENRDAFGFAFSAQTDKQSYWETAHIPYPNGPVGGSVTVPLGSVAAINAIVSPPTSAFAEPLSTANGGPGLGGLYETELYAIYAQHTIDVIPNWLTLIIGETWDTIVTQSIPDWGVLPFQATDVPTSEWIHRLAAVVHLTPAVSLYVLDSTTFTPPPTGYLLKDGLIPPPALGKGTEIGLKWNLWNGRMSGEAAWFKMVSTNGLAYAGNLPTGEAYFNIIGDTTEEGVDGDASFTVVPGWQLIGSWYAGHQVDPFGNPVPYSYQNSWSIFTRYDFDKTGPFKGLSIGGGAARVGGRWESTGGLVYTGGPLPSEVRLQTGTNVNAFVNYSFNRHWLIRVSCSNVLNESYPLGSQAADYNDPSPPRTFTFETIWKF